MLEKRLTPQNVRAEAIFKAFSVIGISETYLTILEDISV